jgi:putative membrane protein
LILYASVPVFFAAIISRAIISGFYPIPIVATVVVTEALLFVSTEVDSIFLKGRNKVATFRRLMSIALISNSFWLILTLVGLAVYALTGSPARFLSLLLLGMFFSASFRALILGSLFFDHHLQAIPLSFLQPLFLFVSVTYPSGLLSPFVLFTSTTLVVSLIGGAITLLGIEVYLAIVNKPTTIKSFRAFDLLQAFLNAWAVEDATNFERFLDATSRQSVIRSEILSISSSNPGGSNRTLPQTVLVIVPGVHPGPFYPIGSSNLPGDIYGKLRTGAVLPLTVHSISDHDLNLPSKKQVERYVSSLQSGKVVDSGAKMSLPVTARKNKATVHGILFGSSVLLTITQAPYGMEDFPAEVRKDIEAFSEKQGYRNVFVIDTHNSEGPKPGEEESRDAVAAASDVLVRLRNSTQYDFEVGFSHSSELAGWGAPDVGPGGVGMLVFKVHAAGEDASPSFFSLIIVDANNSAVTFREKVIKSFEERGGASVLELCTSDTHITAAKTADAKGYLALGDRISVDKMVELLLHLDSRAKSRLASGSFSSSISDADIKTIGSEVLSDFSGLLDAASSVAKNGARVLAIIALAITIVTALV